MKKLAYFLISILSIHVFSQNQKADSLLNVCLEKSKSVGIVAGFAKSGKQYVTAAGFSDRNEGLEMTTETIVRTASVSKLLTSVATMQLVEQGKMNLEDPLSKHIAVPSHLEKVTIRQVLNHSSGIRAYRSNKERENKKHYSSLTSASLIFISDPLTHTPGQSFSYTTYGYVLLGMLIEEVSNTSYEAYLRQFVFNPARMTKTGVENIHSLPKGI
ncbi:MAG: serine hydrolase domain-containing protein, partial [Bacteroidota bacterium]